MERNEGLPALAALHSEVLYGACVTARLTRLLLRRRLPRQLYFVFLDADVALLEQLLQRRGLMLPRCPRMLALQLLSRNTASDAPRKDGVVFSSLEVCSCSTLQS